MKTKNLDILLVGRPDHSLKIYHALSKQDDIRFHFITFKVLPKWMKSFFKGISIQYVDKNVSISVKQTFINICKFVYKFKFAQLWSEEGSLSSLFRRITTRYNPKIIHYWSMYAHTAIEKYASNNPEVICLKDIYMPSFNTIFQTMNPVAQMYGIPEIAEYYKAKISNQIKELQNASTIVVPSEYVLNSYKSLFPDKNYFVISYGIKKSINYIKKSKVSIEHRFRFVYVGRVSLEKGCDVLFEYFSKHPEYELHVYGRIVESQRTILNSKISSNIYLHGTVPKDIVQNEVSKYDIGIHLSRFDAYSLAVSEIIGAGLPVVVSETTGIECDVRNKNLGLVTQNNLESINKQIRHITNPKIFNSFIDSIDAFLNSDQYDYGTEVIKLYKSLLS